MIKTWYRRLSGRKNRNRYLLRYGDRVAYREVQIRMALRAATVAAGMRRVGPGRWRVAWGEQRSRQKAQRKQYRVRHKPATFL